MLEDREREAAAARMKQQQEASVSEARVSGQWRLLQRTFDGAVFGSTTRLAVAATATRTRFLRGGSSSSVEKRAPGTLSWVRAFPPTATTDNSDLDFWTLHRASVPGASDRHTPQAAASTLRATPYQGLAPTGCSILHTYVENRLPPVSQRAYPTFHGSVLMRTQSSRSALLKQRS
jgi:hypothetical protein